MTLNSVLIYLAQVSIEFVLLPLNDEAVCKKMKNSFSNVPIGVVQVADCKVAKLNRSTSPNQGTAALKHSLSNDDLTVWQFFDQCFSKHVVAAIKVVHFCHEQLVGDGDCCKAQFNIHILYIRYDEVEETCSVGSEI